MADPQAALHDAKPPDATPHSATPHSAASERDSSRRDYFPLFALPRELRDLIYEFSLVQDEIVVTPVRCRRSDTDSCKSSDNGSERPNDKPGWYARTTIRQRSTFVSTDESLSTPMTYTYQESEYLPATPPNLKLLSTSRQVYKKASSVYYSKNCFSFPNDKEVGEEVLSAQVALSFLADRPARCWRKIRRLCLHIDSGLVEIDQLGARLHGATMVKLCEFVRDNLQLSRLTLEMRGDPPDVRMTPWQWRPSDILGTNIRPLKWLGGLLLLKGLKALEITLSNWEDNWDIDRGGREVAFVRFLRTHLLRNGQALGSRNISLQLRHDSVWVYNTVFDTAGNKRDVDRLITVCCADNEYGTSFLEPAQHPPATVRKFKNVSREYLLKHFPAERIPELLENDGWPDDVSDGYTASDGGSTDSLKNFEDDLDPTSTVPVRDEGYFELFEKDELEY